MRTSVCKAGTGDSSYFDLDCAACRAGFLGANVHSSFDHDLGLDGHFCVVGEHE